MIDFYFYLTAAIGVVLFGISIGGFAGPIAILAIPIMALIMSPIAASAILLPVLLVIDVVVLGYIGANPPEGLYLLIGRVATIYYFVHFILINANIGF